MTMTLSIREEQSLCREACKLGTLDEAQGSKVRERQPFVGKSAPSLVLATLPTWISKYATG